jgi:hypothetical protein
MGKIEKCYNVKAFMPNTVHWVNEYFIISFVLSHLFIHLSHRLSLFLSSLSLAATAGPHMASHRPPRLDRSTP